MAVTTTTLPEGFLEATRDQLNLILEQQAALSQERRDALLALANSDEPVCHQEPPTNEVADLWIERWCSDVKELLNEVTFLQGRVQELEAERG